MKPYKGIKTLAQMILENPGLKEVDDIINVIKRDDPGRITSKMMREMQRGTNISPELCTKKVYHQIVNEWYSQAYYDSITGKKLTKPEVIVQIKDRTKTFILTPEIEEQINTWIEKE